MGCFKKGKRCYIDYYHNGKRKREVVTIPDKDPSTITLRDAEKALAIRKAEIAQGKFDIHKTEKPIKFENLISAYLEWADENLKAPIVAKAACKNLLDYFKGKNVYGISLWDIEKYKSERKKLGRKPETINKELGALRRMINLSLQGALKVRVGKNPIEGLKLLKVPKLTPRVIKDWEFQKLYNAASSNFKPILLCAYMTGMRRSEIAKLKWKDIDLNEGYINVIESKNGESRTIPIAGALLDTLITLKGGVNREYVFNTPRGVPYSSSSSWRKTWNTTLKLSEIEKCRFHDLRHTFVSNLIVKEKEDFATVMALSGHKDISMLKRYSHTHEDAKRAAVTKLSDSLINSSQKTIENKSMFINLQNTITNS